MLKKKTTQHEYDVVICGGGFAGQTLARQLKLNHSDLSVLILEKAAFPVPEATHKVGESLTDASALYFAHDLQLKPYLEAHQFPKLGFRFFWQNGRSSCFADRPELGLSDNFPFYAYQLDRGRLENDLGKMNVEMGVELLDNVSVVDIELNDDAPHVVSYKQMGSKEVETVNGRWVIDGTGRRSLLQKKLGLRIKSDEPHSSAWFRVKGILDFSELVPESNTSWHERVGDNFARYLSTVHIMGDGWWMWIIPLASGHTSVGIVASEAQHPFTEYSTYERAMAWLAEKDPVVCQKIQEYEVVDFLKLRNYSYSSKQVYSAQRWACIGDAAVFADPFYSVAGVVVALGNSFITEMIGHDQRETLTPELVTYYNDFVIGFNKGLTLSIQGQYPLFGKNHVFALAFLWQLIAGWGVNGPQSHNKIHLSLPKIIEMETYLADTYALMGAMDGLFKAWGEKAQGRITFDFIDYRHFPILEEIYRRRDVDHDTLESLKANTVYAVEKVEEFAQAIFLLMVEDVLPEKLACFPQPIWLNVKAMSLNPDRWEEDGLFKPESEPRDLTEVLEQTRALFRFDEQLTVSNEQFAV